MLNCMQEGPGSFIEIYIFWVFSCHDLLVVLLVNLIFYLIKAGKCFDFLFFSSFFPNLAQFNSFSVLSLFMLAYRHIQS
jgi:hypothetical protein